MKNNIRIFALVMGLIFALMLISCAGSKPAADVKASSSIVPADVQAFFDQFKKDVFTRDMKKIGMHYSKNFLKDGANREAFLDKLAGIIYLVTNYVVEVTKYEVDKNNPNIVVIAGWEDLGATVVPFVAGYMIIKEDGVWKWYGNQK